MIHITSERTTSWSCSATALQGPDSFIYIHVFSRFKITHLLNLLNLRYPETEIAEIEHIIYQLVLPGIRGLFRSQARPPTLPK